MRDRMAVKLLEAMLEGHISEVIPRFDPLSELGFSFPTACQFLGISDSEVLSLLDSLSDEGVLERRFFDKLLRCPHCHSVSVRPIYCCVKCGSADIVRGRMLEHSLCKYTGTDEEFLLVKRKLMCPNCKQELHTLGEDYRSLGILYKCRDCGDIFAQPAVKWKCLACSVVTSGDRIAELNVYSYSLREAQRGRLQFELKPKQQLIQFLHDRGYEVTENAIVKGSSGAEHTFDLLATKNDGVVTHQVAIGVSGADTKPVGLEELFDFDDKTYDAGIHDKVLIAISEVTEEASQFAHRQRIRILQPAAVESLLVGAVSPQPAPQAEAKRGPPRFKSKSELIQYLQSYGYEVEEEAKVSGRSGAEHSFDLLATRDDVILAQRIAIGIEVSDEPIGLGKVFDFDDKAYDCGIPDKVLLAVPALTGEAARLAQHQRIKVFEVRELAPDA
jgi:predicted RNA-binding Zn-ribbon protein involved in translation (DUF1610 family)